MRYQMHAEYGPSGPSDGVKTWHITHDGTSVALCGRELSPTATVQDPELWSRSPDHNCHTCGALFLRETPYMPAEHE
ncbi:hypothetical protein [Streptomyces sp. NRRL B-24484]|uniref:hypothetical protein n=1 Tax=Streptomyces sp. NRRL B-24484 TaxID=1463833 RepID=UPI0004C14FF4|nr:hypothetical protein [Streptomyces sp. NRRL B-24484]